MQCIHMSSPYPWGPSVSLPSTGGGAPSLPPKQLPSNGISRCGGEPPGNHLSGFPRHFPGTPTFWSHHFTCLLSPPGQTVPCLPSAPFIMLLHTGSACASCLKGRAPSLTPQGVHFHVIWGIMRLQLSGSGVQGVRRMEGPVGIRKSALEGFWRGSKRPLSSAESQAVGDSKRSAL